MLCKVAFAAVALACAAVGGRAQTPTLFQADIEVYNDPGMFGGVSGKMYYRKAQAPNVQRIDYDVVGAGYTKVWPFCPHPHPLLFFLGVWNPISCFVLSCLPCFGLLWRVPSWLRASLTPFFV
jgi:hypothetical protein